MLPLSLVKQSDLLPDVSLQPHQQRIADEAEKKPQRKMLMWSLGSGKSLGAIAGAEAYGKPYTAVVPASLRFNLEKERDKFTDKTLPAQVMSYSELARGKPVEHPESLMFDESQRLRTPGAKQTQQALAAAQNAKQVLLMSGTPVVNSPGDLAMPLSMLTNKYISPEDFTERYVGERKVGPGFFGWLRGVPSAHEPAIRNREELKSQLAGKVDYYKPTSPTVATTEEDVNVDMSSDQAKLYRGMWHKLPWLTRWKLERNYPMTPQELQRTQAFLTGPRQVGLSTYPFMGDKKNPYKAYQSSPKLQKANELLQDKLKDERTKALVFSNFIGAGLDPYAAALKKQNVPHAVFHGGLSDVERKKLVEDYNTNKLRVALLGPSGAEGLSFKGTQLVQLLDPYWNSVRGRQSEGRGIRFDSHTGLPPELQNVAIQRFVSKMPLGWQDKLKERMGFDRTLQRRAADDYLRDMSNRKERLNKDFVDLLHEVGTPKEAAATDDILLHSWAARRN